MQHDFIKRLWIVIHITLAPVIRHGISKDVARSVELGCCNGASHFRVPFQSVLCVLVPKVECAVAACGGKGAVLRMEGDGVHGIDVGHVSIVGRCLAVAFEGEVVGRVLVVNVLNRATAFDGSNCKAGAINEGTDCSRLPLKWALQRLVELVWLLEIDDANVSFCCADNQHGVVSNVHCIDALPGIDGGNGLRRSQVPVLDRLVPASRDQHGASIERERFDTSNRLIVSCDLSACSLTCA